MRPLPRFLHVLTAVHAVGAVACLAMGTGSAMSASFTEGLARSGGSRLMMAWFGRSTWLFLAFLGTVLATLAYGSWRVRPWAWALTLVVYGLGVAGALWQVSMGIPQGWVAAAVNGAVFGYAATSGVRRAYLGRAGDL
jgi:hypothetical protein